MLNLNKSRSSRRASASSRWDFRADRSQGGQQNFRDSATQDQQDLVRDVYGAGGAGWARNNRGAAARALQDPAAARERWSRYRTPNGAVAEGSEGVGGAGGAGYLGGDGGDPEAQLTVDEPIGIPDFRDPATLGLTMASPESLKGYSELFDSSVARIGEIADRLTAVNESYLKGELAGDVVAEIRRNAAEKAVSSGMGADSQAARNLRARDLGTTSLAVQQQGFQQATNIAAVRQTMAQLAESRRQFDVQSNLNTQQYMDTIRRTDLTAVAMEQERLQFNARQNLSLVALIADLASARGQVQASLSANGIDSEGAAAGFTQIIGQIDRLLGGN